MAKIRAHVGADGLIYRYLVCSRCRPTCRALGPVALEEADVALADHARKVHGEEPKGRRTAAGEALKGFVRSRRAAQCSEDTVRGYESVLRPFFAHMGEKPLRSWRRVDAEGFIAAHPAWSPRSLQSFLVVATTFTTWAVDAGIDVQPFAAKIRKPRLFRRQVDALTGKQLRALLATSAKMPRRGWLEKVVYLAVYTGLSLRDIRTLDYGHLGPDLARIRKPRHKGRRPLNVPVCADLHAVIEKDRAVSGPVCRDIPKSDSAVAKAMRALYDAAGVPRARFIGLHFLRTSFVSMAVEQTADIAAVAELVGDDVATVARFYTKSRDERRVAVVDAVAAVIRTA